MAEDKLRYKITETSHGFRWGNTKIERLALIGGYRVIRVSTTTGEELSIVVSPAGRSIRVWKNDKELKASDDE